MYHVNAYYYFNNLKLEKYIKQWVAYSELFLRPLLPGTSLFTFKASCKYYSEERLSRILWLEQAVVDIFTHATFLKFE